MKYILIMSTNKIKERLEEMESVRKGYWSGDELWLVQTIEHLLKEREEMMRFLDGKNKNRMGNKSRRD